MGKGDMDAAQTFQMEAGGTCPNRSLRLLAVGTLV